jgi:hypothetical protein
MIISIISKSQMGYILQAHADNCTVAGKGFGKHAWDVLPTNITSLCEFYYTTQILYVLSQTLIKISILVLYLRIFPSRTFLIWTKGTIIFVVLHALAFLLVVIFQCVPISAICNPSIPGRCVNSTALIFAGSGFSIAEDLIIIVLPIPVLKSLQMKLKKKIIIGFMFFIGSL